MKTKLSTYLLAGGMAILSANLPSWAGSEGPSNTFYGQGAGASNAATNTQNTFIGVNAGNSNNAVGNTYVGYFAGNASVGHGNTFLGVLAGSNNSTGMGNVFLGYAAGNAETGSNKLYIDNCAHGVGTCNIPLIYGEFDNQILNINAKLGVGFTAGTTPAYQMEVSAGGVMKSSMHFSTSGNDVGGWITSALDNNFYLSSGAMYDGPGGGWIQKSSDGHSVIAGSQTADGYTVYMYSGGGPPGTQINPFLQQRFQVIYNGSVGMGKVADSSKAIDTATGAYLSLGGAWINASSRAYKDHVQDLPVEVAMNALDKLTPVTFSYKAEPDQEHVGFIAEDVPELVATKDRKGLSAMDVVAVLTKVVQEQKQALDAQKKTIDSIQEQQAEFAQMKKQLFELQEQMQRIKSPT